MNVVDASPSAQTFNDNFSYYLTAYICSAIYEPYPIPPNDSRPRLDFRPSLLHRRPDWFSWSVISSPLAPAATQAPLLGLQASSVSTRGTDLTERAQRATESGPVACHPHLLPRDGLYSEQGNTDDCYTPPQSRALLLEAISHFSPLPTTSQIFDPFSPPKPSHQDDALAAHLVPRPGNT